MKAVGAYLDAEELDRADAVRRRVTGVLVALLLVTVLAGVALIGLRMRSVMRKVMADARTDDSTGAEVRAVAYAGSPYVRERKIQPYDRSNGLFAYGVTPRLLLCDTVHRAVASTQPSVRLDLPVGHTDYVYCADTIRGIGNSDAVLAYEPPSNHGGGWFLYADGRVDFYNATMATPIVKDLQAGINPTTQP
jgi:hypothetical protein